MIKEQPVIAPVSAEVAEAHRETLANGVDLYTLAADEFGVLRVSFVFRAGSSVQKRFFSASAVANLLAEGTANHSARELAEELDFYGSWFDVTIDRDYAYISFCMLSRFVPETLAVAEEIILHPTFPEEEISGYCLKRKQRLKVERQKVDNKARELFSVALFGKDHPYGVVADEEEYDNLTRECLVEFYRTHYTAENCFVVCSGRIGEEELTRVRAIASQLPSGGGKITADLPEPVVTHRIFRRHEGAVQSSIRIGRLLFPRQHPDFTGMQVVATALGGYFGSRLMQNLRAEHGFTYGVMAAMVNFERAGYFAVATQVGSDSTREALVEIDREIERLRREEMSEEELDLVKNMMIGEMMRILDGPFGVADVTIENILCGTDNGAIARQVAEIRRMTPRDVRLLAEKYLRREDLITVVVGEEDPFA